MTDIFEDILKRMDAGLSGGAFNQTEKNPYRAYLKPDNLAWLDKITAEHYARLGGFTG